MFEQSDLWSHVVKHTEHAPLLWTRGNATKIIRSLHLTVPEPVGELQCNLEPKKNPVITYTHSRSCKCSYISAIFCCLLRLSLCCMLGITQSINVYLLNNSGPQAVYGFELPVWKWRVKLDDVLLQKS